MPSSAPMASSSAWIAAVGKVVRVTVGVGEQGVELRPELVSVAERHIDQVARDRDQRYGLPDRVDRSHDHRVRERRRPGRISVDPDQQDVEPLVRARPRRSAWGPVARETAPGPKILANVSRNTAPYRYAATCGTTTSRRMAAMPDETDPTRGSRSTRVQERLPDGEQAPDEEQEGSSSGASPGRRGLRPRPPAG